MYYYCIVDNYAVIMHNCDEVSFMKYIAIIGDIVNSKNMMDRSHTQKKLNSILNRINENYKNCIASKFIITLGDEFQGLLKNFEDFLEIIKSIQREMYPVKIRFGIGIGEISTDIKYEAAIGADGPAYYAARNMIDEIRQQEKRLKKQATDIKISIYEQKMFELDEINTMLMLIKLIEESWSEKQRFTVWDMLENGGSQTDCAQRMQTTQSTIARRLADCNYIVYKETKGVLKEALNRLGEIINDR